MCIKIPFLLRGNPIPLSVYITLFIHSSTDGRLGGLHPLVVVNDVAMNRSEQVSAPVSAFDSFGYISSRETTGSTSRLLAALQSKRTGSLKERGSFNGPGALAPL